MKNTEETNRQSRHYSEAEKNRCLEENKEVTDILFYLGNGYMINGQLKQYCILVKHMSEKRYYESVRDLFDKGLLNKKQVETGTGRLFYLNKYALGKYQDKESGNAKGLGDTSDNKIYRGIFNNEYILQNYRFMETFTIESILERLEREFTTIRTTQGRGDIFELYREFGMRMQCNNDEYILDCKSAGGDYVTILENFNQLGVEERESYIEARAERQKIIAVLSDKDRKKYYYNFYMMQMNGYFFEGLDKEENTIKIGLYNKNNNLTIDKVYLQTGYIYEMLKRYIGEEIKLKVNVYGYGCTELAAISERIKKKPSELAINDYKYYAAGYEKLHKAGVREQEYDNIEFNFKIYDLRNKYKL